MSANRLTCYCSWDDFPLPNLVLERKALGGGLCCRVEPTFSSLPNLSPAHALSLGAALTLAYDRSFRCFLSSEATDGGDIREQDADVYLVLTDDGAAWLCSTLFYKGLIHLQSPIISSFAFTDECPTIDPLPASEGERQIDHVTWSWPAASNVGGAGANPRKLHVTSVRDGKGDGIFRHDDVAHLLAQKMADQGGALAKPLIKPNGGEPRQLFHMTLGLDQLRKLVSLTANMTIGGSQPSDRQALLIRTNLNADSQARAEELVALCRPKLRNHVHILDFRGRSPAGAEVTVSISAYAAPRGAHQASRSANQGAALNELSYSVLPPVYGESYHVSQDTDIQGIPHGMEISLRRTLSTLGAEWQGIPFPTLVCFTDKGQPVINFMF